AMATPSKHVTLSAPGPSTAIPIDLGRFGDGVGLLVTVPAGVTTTYNIEVTGDDPAAGITNWNLHDIMQALSASANGNIVIPVTAVRINALSCSGGTITFSVVQAY